MEEEILLLRKDPYYYGPEGRLVLVDSALEAVNGDQPQ